LHYAFLNSYFQTGVSNVLNETILKHAPTFKEVGVPTGSVGKERFSIKDYSKIDEIPFDYDRRKLSVIVKENGGKSMLICTGAVEEIIASCTNVLADGKVVSLKDFSDEKKLLIEKRIK